MESRRICAIKKNKSPSPKKIGGRLGGVKYVENNGNGAGSYNDVASVAVGVSVCYPCRSVAGVAVWKINGYNK